MTLIAENNQLIFDLPGIRIYYGEILEKEDGRLVCSHSFSRNSILQSNHNSDFYQLFQSILPQLQSYSWLVDLDCFNLYSLNDNDFNKLESYLDSILVDDIVYLSDDREFLKKIAPLVKDDWNQLWGLRKPLNNIKKLLDSYPINSISQEIPSEIDVIFDNYDGAYWSFFAKNVSFHEMIKQDLYERFRKEKFEIKVIDISFKESLEEHQKQWQLYCNLNLYSNQ